MITQPTSKPPAALRVISFLSRMGARIHVQLRRGKPILFPYGATWEKAKRELTIKDSRGEEIGFFNRADVVGCWKENIPLNLEDLETEFLEQIVSKKDDSDSSETETH